MLFSFIETRLFARLRERYLPDADYSSLQEALMQRPDLGALVPASGGVRKARWSQPGRGKRGGVRVIYYVQGRDGVIWMLTIYAKSEEQNIPAHVLRGIKEEIDG